MKLNKQEKKEDRLPINREIKFPKLQLIDSGGNNKGIVTLQEAFNLAETEGLDLVTLTLSGSMGVPVVKTMNFKKKLYEEKKKQSIAKKKQHEVQLKEVRFSPKIGANDLETKLRQVVQFLLNGDKAKITVVLKGREKSLKELLLHPLLISVYNRLQEGIATSGKILIKEKESEGPLGFSQIFFIKKQV